MICFIALIVFAILGIFSAKYRKLAKEAFDCVFRKVTLRKCDTGLDSRIKAEVTSSFMKLNPKIGEFVFRYFQVISWIFTLSIILTLAGLAWGGWNYYAYGNCNGPNAEGFCVFDPGGDNTGFSQLGEQGCSTPELMKAALTSDINLSYAMKLKDGKNEVIFIGCYGCEYTRKAYPAIKQLLDEDTAFYFIHFPVKDFTKNITPVVNCLYEEYPEKVTSFNDILFSTPAEELGKNDTIIAALHQIGVNEAPIFECANSNQTQAFTQKQNKEVIKTGIYGTPLVFVNDQPVVGPKPLRVYKRLLK